MPANCNTLLKPRILLVLTEFPPRIGGMQTHALHLACGLAGRGYPIEVVTYRPEHPDRAAAVDSNLPFTVRRILSRIGHFHNLDLLECCARGFKPDLIYCSTIFYGQLGTRLGLPVVCRSVGNDVMRPWIVWPYRALSKLVSASWFERRLYRFFRQLDYPERVERLLMRQRHALASASARSSRYLLANSNYTANLLTNIGVESDRIAVLPGGVDAAQFARPQAPTDLRARLGIGRNRYVLLTVCRLVRKKGIDFLLASMGRILQQFSNSHLLVVGTGRQRRRIRKLAKAVPWSDRITLTGAVANASVHHYYAIADAFVLASRVHVDQTTGLRDAETMGRALCEANAAGVPVAASRSGGIPSIISHQYNGLLFEPDDVESLCQALAILRGYPAKTHAMVQRGRRLAREKFDWAHLVDAHEACFREVLTHCSTPSACNWSTPAEHAAPGAQPTNATLRFRRSLTMAKPNASMPST